MSPEVHWTFAINHEVFLSCPHPCQCAAHLHASSSTQRFHGLVSATIPLPLHLAIAFVPLISYTSIHSCSSPRPLFFAFRVPYDHNSSPPSNPLNLPPRFLQPATQLPFLVLLLDIVMQLHQILGALQIRIVFVVLVLSTSRM
jgi:hypothetical protein